MCVRTVGVFRPSLRLDKRLSGGRTGTVTPINSHRMLILDDGGRIREVPSCLTEIPVVKDRDHCPTRGPPHSESESEKKGGRRPDSWHEQDLTVSTCKRRDLRSLQDQFESLPSSITHKETPAPCDEGARPLGMGTGATQRSRHP